MSAPVERLARLVAPDGETCVRAVRLADGLRWRITWETGARTVVRVVAEELAEVPRLVVGSVAELRARAVRP
jgi:hypothetical protein